MKEFDLLYLVPTDVADDEGHRLADVYGISRGDTTVERITTIDCLWEFPAGIQCDFDYNSAINRPCLRFWCVDHKLAFDCGYIKVI